MTSFNNVILAGEASKESVEKSDAVGRLIPRQQTLTFDEVAAFEINNGSIRSIMDDEFHKRYKSDLIVKESPVDVRL